MEREYRTLTIRRLFIEDMPWIEKYAACFDGLFFNPLSEKLLPGVFVQGAFWAVCDGEIPVAVTYILDADSHSFAQSAAGWHLTDLLGEKAGHCLVCGYLWTDEQYSHIDLYTPITKLWMIQAERKNKTILVHLVPSRFGADFEKLFYNDFQLIALRGLDNLVPYWIFTRKTDVGTEKTLPYEDVKKCPLSDTKGLSQLCEKGYRAFDMDMEKNLLFRR
ncbi:MAG: hypothetical protein IKK99_09260 [Oscillospiraceae bacterium]|nr:hypothetical protein [Oscillospiraceae bacterium]